MIKLALPESRPNRRWFGTLLTCFIFLATCTFLLVFMINLLSDHGHAAIELDRMTQQRRKGRVVQAKGIQNSGNICFASSVAQMLFRIDQVHDFVLSVDDKINLPSHETRPILGLKSLFKSLDVPGSDSVKEHHGQFIPSQFPASEQGDSEEFYTAWMGLLEKIMGEELRDNLFLKVTLNRTSTEPNQSTTSSDFWSTLKVTFPENTINQNQPIRIEDLLAHPQGPFGEELLTSTLRQNYRIAALPNILAVSFVRTVYDPKKGLTKVNTPVQIPEILDLAPFMASNTTTSFYPTTKFKLKMFVLHRGNNAEGGHYVAYVQDTQDLWQIVDDEKIRSMLKQGALNAAKQASICFFEKW